MTLEQLKKKQQLHFWDYYSNWFQEKDLKAWQILNWPILKKQLELIKDAQKITEKSIL